MSFHALSTVLASAEPASSTGGPAPRQAARVALIGNSLPRLCGIATFTNDLERSLSQARPGLFTTIVAMNEPGQSYDYPPCVSLAVREDRVEDYRAAAAGLNDERIDAVCLQHEFGIFGGAAGGDVLALLAPLTMPLISTFHTVLARPSTAQHDVMSAIINLSAKVVVMAEKGRELLQSVYRAPPGRVEVIPHGVPDFPLSEPDAAKARHGLEGRTVILTFGLLAPSKGVDLMIEAMPEILSHCPTATYVILGATHPNLLRQEGEAYREALRARVRALSLEDHVVFLNQFVDQAMLLEFISLCDVYVTPYRNEAQLTSGTLAFSVGLGKPVVSTPYWHAAELLADGGGVLVPFDDVGGFGREVSALLLDEPRRLAMRRHNYANSRRMIWPRTAERYLKVIDGALARRVPAPQVVTLAPAAAARPGLALPTPELRRSHLLSMCDDTGLYQHAIGCVPDRRHGYCVDDNARALLLAARLVRAGETPLPEGLTTAFCAFVQHAWNPEAERFRNFMAFDRRWLEAQGSEDSHARTLWALGEYARSEGPRQRGAWAAGLFRDALPVVEGFSSPRAFAFTLLGLDAYLERAPEDWRADRLRRHLADSLLGLLAANETPGWIWFEQSLAYDNARLSQALIASGVALNERRYLAAGVRSLRWLAEVQTSPEGHFRPVGTQSFGRAGRRPEAFDQQPVEAAASIDAYLAASSAEGEDPRWSQLATSAFSWFQGQNDLGLALVDLETGGCRDGLHPDRANENQGAESVLSYLLGLVAIRQNARMGNRGANPPRLRANTG